jgi:hypothetical protein
MEDLMRSADVVVFVLSGQPSLWIYREIEYALAHKMSHIVPVVVGSITELFPSFGGVPSLPYRLS